MAGDTGSVVAVTVDGEPVGSVFGVNGRFWFLLNDERDSKPRGGRHGVGYHSLDAAVMAAEHQFRCMEIADRWEIMLDT
jgi:hypothetical protein